VAFNLSHTASLVACAVVSTAGESAVPTEAEVMNVEVGVDVEAGSRKLRGGVDKLARRWLSAAEAATLAELPDGPARATRFLQLWTLKEACVKAAGTGIGASPTPSFTVQLRPAQSLHLAEQLRATTGLPVDGDGMEIRMVDAGPSLPDASYHFLQLRMDAGELVTLCTLAQCVGGGGGGGIAKLRVWQGTRPEQMQPTHKVTVVGGSLHTCAC
jgi:phosphopantetheine--protein transferase-like protein